MLQILQSYKSGDLWLSEVPVPACKSNGVIVQTNTSFVSAGTERMLVDFAKKNIVGKAMAMPDQVKKVIRKMKSEGIWNTIEKVQAKLDQPIPLGYSCSGTIVEIGRDVSNFMVGDRVACGGAGYANHAQYNYIPKNLLVKLPESVDFVDASSATVGSIALQGVRQCDIRLGEIVCVMGLGLLGIMAVQMLKASGAIVIGFDPSEGRCKLAEKAGADFTTKQNIHDLTESVSEGNGVDAVLITAATKSNEPVTAAGEICKPKGKVVVTGMVGMDIPRDMYYKKELDFKLSLSYGPGRYDASYEEAGVDYPYGYVRWTEQRNIKAVIDLIAQKKLTPSELITHRFSIENALDAYQLLLGKIDEPYLGIVITYPDTSTKESSSRKLILNETSAKNSTIGIGFIGAGNFTKGVLFPEMRANKKISLVGLCTATGMNAAETGKKEHFAYATTDYEALLTDASINTVFITTQHNTHARFITESLEAGKNVFVEKPLCINEQEMELIQSSLDTSQSILTVGYNRRFSPHCTLAAGYFSQRTTPMVVHYRINAGIIPPDVWIQDIHIGGGRIIGEVCHFIDTISYLTGSLPHSVSAVSVDSTNKQHIAEDNVSISVKYQDGSVGNIVYVALGASDLPKEYIELFADESAAVINDFKETKCFGKLGKKSIKGKQDKGFSAELKMFFNTIESGKQPPISYESLIKTSQTTFAIRKSIQTGQTVQLA